MQILHFAGIAEVQPIAEKLQLRKRGRRRDAAEIETDGGGLALDVRR
jgi:hypothetical protein